MKCIGQINIFSKSVPH